MHVQERSDCANCGAALAGAARFCQRCGAPVAQLPAADEGDEDELDEVPDPLAELKLWGLRVAAGLLIAVTAAVALFALLAILFGVNVE